MNIIRFYTLMRSVHTLGYIQKSMASGRSYGPRSTDATGTPRKTFGGVEGAETQNMEDSTKKDVV